MATYDVGGVRVRIEGDADNLQRAAKQTQQSLSSLESAFASVTRSLVAMGLAAAGPAVLFKLVHSSLEAVDAQQKLAFRLNATTEEIQVLSHAAKLAGVAEEELASSAQRMTSALAEAAREGKGPAYDALRRIGIAAKDFVDLPIDQKLKTLADQFQKLGLNTAQQAAVLRDFGIRGGKLVEMLGEGSAAFDRATRVVREYGLAVNEIDAMKIVKANDAITDALAVFRGFGNIIATELAMPLEDLANSFTQTGENAEKFREKVRKTMVDAARFIDQVTSAWERADKAANANTAIMDKVTAAISAWFRAGLHGLPIEDDLIDKNEELSFSLGELADGVARVMGPWEQWINMLQGGGTELQQWNQYIREMGIVLDVVNRQLAAGRKGAGLDALSEEQAKAQKERLIGFKKGLADQFSALKFQQEAELKQIKEFEANKTITSQEAARLRAQVAEKFAKEERDKAFAQFGEDVMTELEQLKFKHARKLEELTKYEIARGEIEGTYAEMRKKMNEKFALEELQLISRQYSALAGIVETSMGQIKQLIGNQGGAAFEIMKAISMATALVKGFEAVVSAYAAGAAVGGPPLGAAFAAIAAAGVAAQIANIARTKPETAGAGAGALTAAAPAATAPAPSGAAVGGPTQILMVQGLNPSGLFSGSVVRDLAGKLLDYQRDGGKVVIQ